MKMNFSLAAIFGFWLAATSMTAFAASRENVTAAEWTLLPRYCPDTQAYPGYQEHRAQWEALMGKGFGHMHHYCWARLALLRAQRSSMSRQEKHELYTGAVIDLQYVVRNTDDHFILLPEVLTWLGRAYILLPSPVEADKAFAKARAIKPDYWPAYSHWAEFLQANGHKAEALALVKSGLQYAPEAKVLNELFTVLGGKPGDRPPPVAKKPDLPIPETPSPEQAANPPATATEAQSQ